MAISTLKQQIHHLIDTIDDEGMLNHLLHVLHKGQVGDFFDNLSPAELSRLPISLKQAENHEGVNHLEMRKKVESWFMKYSGHPMHKKIFRKL